MSASFARPPLAPSRARQSAWALALLALGALAASAPLAACADPSFGPGDPLPPTGGSGGLGMGGNPADIEIDETFPGGVSRFRRLTHRQWEATVRDLFAWREGPGLAEGFRRDPKQSGYLFDGNGDALEVDQALWLSYQNAAAEVAIRAVAEGSVDPWLPEDGTEQERVRAFLRDFGARVHRRPLTDEQIDGYLAVFEIGKTAYEDAAGMEGGLRLVIEALLQSPYFLYRVEESDGVVEGGFIALDGYERAARLSYFLWGTMPDAKLFAAAERGELDDAEGVKAQATRMIEDSRAVDVLVDFFERVLEVERYETISPADSVFPEAPEALGDLALEETRAFLRGVMGEETGSLRDLLTSRTTYVNADLAQLYGLSGSYDESFVSAKLPEDERSGVLTQIGFLASHATNRDPDPIHRGVFVARRISCLTISAPPDGVPPLPPNPGDKTNRELVAEHTEQEGSSCSNCHATIINPYGFAFENFDAMGAYRTMDGDKEVDAGTDVFLDGEYTPVADALELSQALAESPAVHRCFSGHLVSFALGRPALSEDADLVDRLGDASLDGGVSFSDLLVEMAVAVSFLNRTAAEEP